MKKNVIELVISMTILVVVSSVFVSLAALNTQQNKEAKPGTSSQAEQIILSQFASAGVTSIDVTLKNQHFRVVSTAVDNYTIEGFEGYPLSSEELVTLADQCANLSALKKLSSSDAGNGLGDPVAVLVVSSIYGDDYTIKIGADAYSGEQVYLSVSGKEGVYLADKKSVSRMLFPCQEFVDKAITPPLSSPQPPKEVTFGGSVRPLPITMALQSEKADDPSLPRYQVTSPGQTLIYAETALPIIQSVFSMTAEKIISMEATPQEMNSYGLDYPFAMASLTTEEQSFTLISSEPKDGYCYMMRDDSPVIYQVADKALTWLTAQYKDFVKSIYTLPQIKTVKTFTVSSSTRSFVFALTHSEDQFTVTCNQKEVDAELFTELFKTITAIPPVSFTTDTPTEVNSLRMLVEYTDGNKDLISLFPAPGGKAFLALNGVSNYLTDKDYTDLIIENCQNVLLNTAILPLQ